MTLHSKCTGALTSEDVCQTVTILRLPKGLSRPVVLQPSMLKV